MLLRFRKLNLFAVLFLYFYLVFPRDAHAYLDPGTGSYFLQLLLAGLLGTTFMIKTFWAKLKVSFINLFSKNQEDAESIPK